MNFNLSFLVIYLKVCTSGGISCLARALAKFCNIEDVTEPALCTLRHCTVRHPLAHQAQNELRFAHPIILALLATGRPPIVKASLGLLRNCSLSNENLRLILNVCLIIFEILDKNYFNVFSLTIPSSPEMLMT